MYLDGPDGAIVGLQGHVFANEFFFVAQVFVVGKHATSNFDVFDLPNALDEDGSLFEGPGLENDRVHHAYGGGVLVTFL